MAISGYLRADSGPEIGPGDPAERGRRGRKCVRKNSEETAVGGRLQWQGLKPSFIERSLLARLKPCPCYKATFIGFFRKVAGRTAAYPGGGPGASARACAIRQNLLTLAGKPVVLRCRPTNVDVGVYRARGEFFGVFGVISVSWRGPWLTSAHSPSSFIGKILTEPTIPFAASASQPLKPPEAKPT
jgi:hypothetical protein